MNHDRNALITAYRHYTGCTDTEAGRVIRGVELAYAERQNAELQRALDEADGLHMKELSTLRERIRALHQPITGEGGPYCETCTQGEAQLWPVAWSVPSPCPTVQELTST